jgi:hypothetical protein
MDEALFWSLIARLDWNRTGDDDGVLEPMVEALARMPEGDIFRFEDILAEKLYALDSEAHARHIGEDSYGNGEYFSPDLFLYARCCAVANGRVFYLRALGDPTRMPKDMEFETLLYAAAKAFERKTGRTYDYTPEVDPETGSNKSGWAPRVE